MHCPEVIITYNKYFYLARNGAADYGSRKAPLRERLNIFRYELILRGNGKHRLHVNNDGKAWLRISNIIYRIKVATCRHDYRDRVYCVKCFRGKP